MEQHWKLYVLGVRGSWPVAGEQFAEFGTSTSCYVLKRGDHAIVIDCGSGFNSAKALLADCERIDLLLTHIHYDHLIGLLAWGNVFPKGVTPRFYADFSRWFGEKTISEFFRRPFWPYEPQGAELIQVPSPGEVELTDGVKVRLAPSNHPDGASLIRVDLGDFSVCAAFDYEHGREFPGELAENCDLLIFDAMYTEEEYPDRVGWGHSCWQEGCKVADRFGVKKLTFTHHATERTDAQLREMETEAQKVRPDVRFLREGDVIELNEKGGTLLWAWK